MSFESRLVQLFSNILGTPHRRKPNNITSDIAELEERLTRAGKVYDKVNRTVLQQKGIIATEEQIQRAEHYWNSFKLTDPWFEQRNTINKIYGPEDLIGI